MRAKMQTTCSTSCPALLRSACNRRFQCQTNKPCLQRSLRRRVSTSASLQSDMAKEESSRIAAPQGVTQPRRRPEVAPATFGFVERAERWNSRACMIGFFALLIVELAANRGLLDMLGFRIGAGLPFEI